MIYKAMKLGYCLKGRVLDCADFGVAAHKKYFVVIACAPGREMPDFPPPKTSVPRTLKDAISDLEWSNATCRPSGKGFATEFPHLTVDQRQALSWHCTGCYLPDVTSWDPDVTVAKWEEPLPGKLSVFRFTPVLSMKRRCRRVSPAFGDRQMSPST